MLQLYSNCVTKIIFYSLYLIIKLYLHIIVYFLQVKLLIYIKQKREIFQDCIHLDELI